VLAWALIEVARVEQFTSGNDRTGGIMRSATVFCLLCICLAAALAAPPTGSVPINDKLGQTEYASSQAAFEAGQKRGRQDGLAAGVLSRGKVRLSDGNVLLQVADARSYGGSYSADYDRGYRSGYDAGYAEGEAAGKNGGLGWGGGFCMGFLLGLIGVIIAAVV
jgi:hypothetical protein